jgi:hypothetical protein
MDKQLTITPENIADIAGAALVATTKGWDVDASKALAIKNALILINDLDRLYHILWELTAFAGFIFKHFNSLTAAQKILHIAMEVTTAINEHGQNISAMQHHIEEAHAYMKKTMETQDVAKHAFAQGLQAKSNTGVGLRGSKRKK